MGNLYARSAAGLLRDSTGKPIRLDWDPYPATVKVYCPNLKRAGSALGLVTVSKDVAPLFFSWWVVGSDVAMAEVRIGVGSDNKLYWVLLAAAANNLYAGTVSVWASRPIPSLQTAPFGIYTFLRYSTTYMYGQGDSYGPPYVVLRADDDNRVSITSALDPQQVGRDPQWQFTASGGAAPYKWSIDAGALPAGTSLSETGFWSGTPSDNANSSFTLRVFDSAGYSATQQFTVSWTQLSSSSWQADPGGYVDVPYSREIYGGPLGGGGGYYIPYDFALLAGAPSWLSVARQGGGNTGVVSGTPTNSGSFTYTVKVSNSRGYNTTSDATLAVIARPAIRSGDIALTAGTASNQQLSGSDGLAPYTWSASGLPSWASLSSSGLLTGTPTQGTTSVTLTLTDAHSLTAQKTVSIIVAAAVSVTTTSLPDGRFNHAYSQQLQATGGTGSLSWTLQSGTLPTGLYLSSGGLISGTPGAAPVTKTFTVRATDTVGSYSDKSLTLHIST